LDNSGKTSDLEVKVATNTEFIILLICFCLATGSTGRSGFDPRHRQRIFPIPSVQTGSGAHPASCTTDTGGPFPGAKARPGRDSDHSLSSAEVENE
jgi:hypothetical protein